MDEYDELDTYDGDPVHDGWVDFDYHENTGELSGLFEDTDLDQFIDNLNDKRGQGGNSDNWSRTSGRISGFNANEQKVHDYTAKYFKARAANPALWRGTVSRQEGNKCEIIIKTDSQTGNKVICIFSETDQNVSIGGSGIDLINGGNVSGNVSVKAWIPAFIKMN